MRDAFAIFFLIFLHHVKKSRIFVSSKIVCVVKLNNSIVKSIIRFFCSLNGVFAPKSPLDNPEFAEMYASIMEMSRSDPKNDRINLRNDMVRLGNDFKKATRMAKEMLNVE